MKDKPDIVIIATGNKPFVPPIKGVTNDNVVFAEDVLLGKVAVGKNVVIIGGGLVGAETADHLATHGSKVTIVEMLPEIVKDGEANPKLLLKKRLAANNVDIYVSCSVSEITNDSVIITKQGEKKLLADVDTVILATGAKSYAPLAEELQGFHGKVEVLGDAKEARNGYIAIQEAFEKCIDL